MAINVACLYLEGVIAFRQVSVLVVVGAAPQTPAGFLAFELMAVFKVFDGFKIAGSIRE